MLRALCHQVLLEFDTRPTRHAPYQMIDFDIHEDSEPQRVRPRRRRSSKKRVSFGYRQFLDAKENLVNVERITPLPKATPPAKRVRFDSPEPNSGEPSLSRRAFLASFDCDEWAPLDAGDEYGREISSLSAEDAELLAAL